MVRAMPASLGAQALRGRLGEIALALALLACLGAVWSDGTPYRDPVVDPVARASTFVPAPTMNFTWFGAAVGGRPQLTFPPPAVPIAAPVTILIPALNVHRPVEPVGLDPWGVMYVPRNLWNAGWFEDGPVPGAPGDSVIEGHAGYPNAPLLFGKLGSLRLGDSIVVVLADGSRQLFVVRSVRSWPAWSHPTGLFDADSKPRLTLITCTGVFDAKSKTYPDRLVVEATYVGHA